MTKEELEKIIKLEGFHYEFERHGLTCVIHRNSNQAWCGYVGVDKNNKGYGKNYCFWSESELGLSDTEKFINNIEVHGGITFADKAYWKENDDKWYFGFDCVHAGDLSLLDFYFKEIPPSKDSAYRTKDYVISECDKLAEQLIKLND